MVHGLNFFIVYKEEEMRVVTYAFSPLIEGPLAWEVQLVVESSKNQFACEALNDWIQYEQHENINEVIHLDPISYTGRNLCGITNFILTKLFPKFDLHIGPNHVN